MLSHSDKVCLQYAWVEDVKRECRADPNNGVRTLGGREKRFPDIVKKDAKAMSGAERGAVNYLPQVSTFHTDTPPPASLIFAVMGAEALGSLHPHSGNPAYALLETSPTSRLVSNDSSLPPSPSRSSIHLHPRDSDDFCSTFLSHPRHPSTPTLAAPPPPPPPVSMVPHAKCVAGQCGGHHQDGHGAPACCHPSLPAGPLPHPPVCKHRLLSFHTLVMWSFLRCRNGRL